MQQVSKLAQRPPVAFSGPPLPATPPHRNITDIVWDRAAGQPGFPLLRRRSGQNWVPVTAAAFVAEARQLAKGLVGSGLQPGERVALMSRTRYEWAVLDFAIWAAGGVSVPVYETASPEQVRWILGDSGTRVLIVETAEHVALWSSMATELPAVREVWQIEPTHAGRGLDALIACGAAVTDEAVEQRRSALDANTPATVIYTSGTMGRPKGCELTHGNFLSEIDGVLVWLHEIFGRPDAAALLFLPLAHVLARVIQLAVLAGGVELGHSPDVKNLLTDLESFRPTFLLAVPRVFEKVYNSAEQKAESTGRRQIFAAAVATAVTYSRAKDTGEMGMALRLRHLVFDRLVYGRLRAALGGRIEFSVCGGAPLGERLGHFFRGAGLTVLEGYGLTESTAAVTVNTPSNVRIGTVGKPLPGVTVRIAEDGEVQLTGGQVFSGYSADQAGTSAAFTADGFFRTGDLGELDAEGYLRITGRSKEILVTAGGKNVAPAALEDRVRAAALVSQCLVVGDGRPFIAALVTLDAELLTAWLEARRRPRMDLTEAAADPQVRAAVQAAIDAANAEFSRAESIRRFRILPTDFTEAAGHLTPSMKLRREKLVGEFADEIEALYS